MEIRMNKKVIGSIYLYKDHAVLGLQDLMMVAESPLELAKDYTKKQVDEIIIYLLSKTDEEKELSYHTLKELTANVAIPIIGAHGVVRMEDAKKLLYAGCKKVVVCEGPEGNLTLLEEVSLKFGRDKVICSIEREDGINGDLDKIVKYASELYVSDVILQNTMWKRLDNCITIVRMEVGTLAQMEEHLSSSSIQGIAGNLVVDRVDDMETLKKRCCEKGIEMDSYHTKLKWSELKTLEDGLLPVIVQDEKTKEVLMMAYMNEEAYETTLKSRVMTYYSRSRQELWVKGDTSGHYQYVRSLTADCDKDTLLAKVVQVGVACHTGAYSCFFEKIITNSYEEANPIKVFQDVYDVILDRKSNPKEGSYTNYLFDKGIDKILKKLGEEATEIVIASKNPNAEEIKYEIADFLYHMMVLMAEKNVTWEEITTELANR